MLANGNAMTTRARLKDDGTVVEILRDGSERPLAPEVDWSRIDATTEEEIAFQIAEDEAEAMRDAAAWARRVRRKLGLSQVAFARRIGVPVDTVRNWEQGKRAPQGPARRCCVSSTALPKRRFTLWTGPDREANPVGPEFPLHQ
jgi:putative transcriptional regulator